MKILAIDTATEQCSATVVADDATWSRVAPTARAHADLILPMIDDVLRESALKLGDMDCLAFGRGPGSFTGVRIAVSVIQGLALAADKPVVGVSNLAAVAQQAVSVHTMPTGGDILVCMDARMQEVYWAHYRVGLGGNVELVGSEQVSPPAAVTCAAVDRRLPASGVETLGVGTGWRAYSELGRRFPELRVDASLLPRAQEVAHLAIAEFRAGRAVSAAAAQPVYLRDQVAVPSR